MKIFFEHNTPQYTTDMFEIFRGFFPYLEEGSKDDVEVFHLTMDTKIFEEEVKVTMVSDVFENFNKIFRFKIETDLSFLERKRAEKWNVKIALYRTLSFLSNVNLPYGALTGVRPTKLFADLGEKAEDFFREEFSVSTEKLQLVKKVVETQKDLKNKNDEYDFFVNIPFCPTRCAYCSFVSTSISKQKEFVQPYVESLLKEIESQKEIIAKNSISIRAVYVGGGTPTSLQPKQLERILKACNFGQKETTVEAGRPDTISRAMVNMLKRNGVSRLSVNPQTFHDKTLKLIGRHHTNEDTLNAFKLCKKKFDINMDLIAMLPNETFDDFKISLDTAIKLSPANITVHTLYMKKGSPLKESGFKETNVETARQMVDYAYQKLSEAGYLPYYMYRQKYTSGNLENVGYSKPQKECLYNIDIMQEDTSIMAVGAGAIAKKFQHKEKYIERFAHCKEPKDYLERIDEMIEKNFEFWNLK